ncbi:MAG: BRCT domain-containing protein, partial [Candidatus Bipolaricaulia bacterium]
DLKNASREELTSINEIGPEVGESIVNFFSTESNLELLNQLEEVGVEYENERRTVKNTLEGTRFVFTGSLEDYTRSEARETVERLGGRATSSVSSLTDYLVAGENPGSKYENAQEQDVEIIDEEEFKELIQT